MPEVPVVQKIVVGSGLCRKMSQINGRCISELNARVKVCGPPKNTDSKRCPTQISLIPVED